MLTSRARRDAPPALRAASTWARTVRKNTRERRQPSPGPRRRGSTAGSAPLPASRQAASPPPLLLPTGFRLLGISSHFHSPKASFPQKYAQKRASALYPNFFVPEVACSGGGGEIKKKVIGHPNGILKYQTGKTVPVQAQQIPAQLHRSLILLWVGSTRRLSHAEGLRPSSCASRTDTASGLNPSLYYALNPSFFNSVLPEFPSFFSPLNTSFPCTQISTLGSVAFPALERDQFPKPQRQQRTLCFGAGVSPGHSSTALRTLASVQIGSMC